MSAPLGAGGRGHHTYIIKSPPTPPFPSCGDLDGAAGQKEETSTREILLKGKEEGRERRRRLFPLWVPRPLKGEKKEGRRRKSSFPPPLFSLFPLQLKKGERDPNEVPKGKKGPNHHSSLSVLLCHNITPDGGRWCSQEGRRRPAGGAVPAQLAARDPAAAAAAGGNAGTR